MLRATEADVIKWEGLGYHGLTVAMASSAVSKDFAAVTKAFAAVSAASGYAALLLSGKIAQTIERAKKQPHY